MCASDKFYIENRVGFFIIVISLYWKVFFMNWDIANATFSIHNDSAIYLYTMLHSWLWMRHSFDYLSREALFSEIARSTVYLLSTCIHARAKEEEEKKKRIKVVYHNFKFTFSQHYKVLFARSQQMWLSEPNRTALVKITKN